MSVYQQLGKQSSQKYQVELLFKSSSPSKSSISNIKYDINILAEVLNYQAYHNDCISNFNYRHIDFVYIVCTDIFASKKIIAWKRKFQKQVWYSHIRFEDQIVLPKAISIYLCDEENYFCLHHCLWLDIAVVTSNLYYLFERASACVFTVELTILRANLK